MSIQDFHTQLSTSNDQSELMESLRALCQLDNLDAVASNADDAGGWAIWDGPAA
jgi:hypothetical protein